MPLAQGTVGPIITTADGNVPPSGLRQGRLGDAIVSELHGRFYEQVYRGNVYSTGMGLTALSATTIGLTATCTPILGVWNPASSSVNLVILQCALGFVLNTLTTPTGPGAMLWASSVGNSGINTGSTPLNRKTLASSGSQAKAFPLSPPLGGLTNSIVVFEAADFPQPSGQAAGTIAASTANSAFASGFNGVQNFDGSLIVPPGGVLALINTTSTTTYSAAGRLMWEEVPL